MNGQSSNPYAAPPSVETAVTADRATRYQRVGQAVVFWERLRLLYNAILIPYCLILVVAFGFTTSKFNINVLFELVFGGVLSNLCFCAGPLVDGYLAWFGLQHRYVTIALFVAGLLLTMFAATIVLLASMFNLLTF